MNFLHLEPHATRRKRKDPKNTKKGYPNIVKRDFKPTAPNEIYTTDITYIHSNFAKDGFYIDCFNNEIFGVTLSENPDTKLVMKL